VFKRLFWLGLGMSLGAGTSWWVTRTVKQKLQRYLPQQLSDSLTTRARAVRGDVRAAIADGRQAMHEQESALRAQLDTRYAPKPR